jgi:hypothetical protein
MCSASEITRPVGPVTSSTIAWKCCSVSASAVSSGMGKSTDQLPVAEVIPLAT